MVVKTFTKVSDLPTILFHKIGIGLQKSKFLRFSKFLKVQSTAVEIYEKPYVKQASPALGGPVRSTSQRSEREIRPVRPEEDTRRVGALIVKRLRSFFFFIQDKLFFLYNLK